MVDLQIYEKMRFVYFDLIQLCVYVFFFLKVEKIEFLNLRLIVKKFGID